MLKNLVIVACFIVPSFVFGETLIQGKYIEMEGAKSTYTSRNPYIKLCVGLNSDNSKKYQLYFDLIDCGDNIDVKPGGTIKIKTQEGQVYEFTMSSWVNKTSSLEFYPFVGPIKVYHTVVGSVVPTDVVSAFVISKIVKYRFELNNGLVLDYTLSPGKANDLRKELKSEYQDITEQIKKVKTVDSDF